MSSFAQTGNIERLRLLLTNGNKRQRETVAHMLAEEGLTEDDIKLKSIAALSTPDLNIRAIIFSVT